MFFRLNWPASHACVPVSIVKSVHWRKLAKAFRIPGMAPVLYL